MEANEMNNNNIPLLLIKMLADQTRSREIVIQGLDAAQECVRDIVKSTIFATPRCISIDMTQTPRTGKRRFLPALGDCERADSNHKRARYDEDYEGDKQAGRYRAERNREDEAAHDEGGWKADGYRRPIEREGDHRDKEVGRCRANYYRQDEAGDDRAGWEADGHRNRGDEAAHYKGD